METEGWHTEYDSLEAGQTEETSEIKIIPKTKAAIPVDFDRKLKDTEVQEGEYVVLECKTLKEANVTWKKDGSELTASDRWCLEKTDTVHKLIISKAQLEDDGKYTAFVGQNFSSCSVRVKAKPVDFVRELNDKEVPEGDRVLLQCETSKGESVTWKKDGSELTTSKRYSLETSDTVHKLKIAKVKLEDKGTYTAHVGNKTTSCTLKVKGQPAPSNRTCKLEKNGNSKYVRVSGIPRTYTADSMKVALFVPDFPVGPPALVYIDGHDHAILICQKEEDAKSLSEYRQDPFRFKLMTKQELSQSKMKCNKKFQYILHSKNKREDVLKKLREIDVEFDENGLELKACTSYQLQCASLIIERYSQEEDTNSTKDKEADFERTFCNVPPPMHVPLPFEIVFHYLRSKYQSEFSDFKEKYGEITYKEGDMIIPCTDENENKEYVMKLKNYVEGTDIFAITVELRHLNIVEQWLKELRVKHMFCELYADLSKFVICCDSYDDLLSLRHQYKVKTKQIRETALSRRIQTNESPDDSHVSNSFKSEEAYNDRHNKNRRKQFTLDTDAEMLKSFKTIENIKVYAYKADILNLPVDCIVNAANDTLDHGSGVALAIARAAGPLLTEEGKKYIRTKGKLSVGSVYSTTAGDLQYKCVIHTVGPRWSDYFPHDRKSKTKCKDHLYEAIYSCFCEADKKNLRSIALPAVSSAILGVPIEICVKQYAKATINYSRFTTGKGSTLREIHFVDIKPQIVQQIQQEFQACFSHTNLPALVERKESEGAYISKLDMESSIPESNILPEPLLFETGWKRQTFRYANNELKMCKGNVLSEKASTIVVTSDEKGVGGAIKRTLESNIPDLYRDCFKHQFAEMIKPNRNCGSIFKIDGYASGYKYIINIVYPRSALSQPSSKREQELQTIFSTLLQMIDQDKTIHSVVTGQFGIANSKDDQQMWSKAFLYSFIKHCKQQSEAAKNDLSHLDVTIVCQTDDAYAVLFDVIHEYTMVAFKRSSSKETDQE